MGSTCSCSSQPHSLAQQKHASSELKAVPVPTLKSMESLRGIFPQWDEVSLRNVIVKCEGTSDETVDHLLTWGSEDRHIHATSTNLAVQPRQGYDIFMRAHLLRHTTPTSNIISIQAAAKFIAQAHLAKKVVAQRRLTSGCNSDIACLPGKQKSEDNSESSDKCSLSREDKIIDGLRLMKERLQFLNLRMVTMEDDGNCQFRAISYELYGSQCYHHVVREKVVQHLRSNSEMFSFYVGEEKEWIHYLQKMSLERTWGDELTITAASQVFAVNIHVITTEVSNWLLDYGIDNENNDVVAEKQKEIENEKGETEEKNIFSKRRHLFLLYISPIHYNVVAPPHPEIK